LDLDDHSRQPPPSQPKLLARVREAIRVRHYSPRTEQAYVGWIRRYVFFHKVRHPADMGKDEVTRFLTHLALSERVSASTQNQAFNALPFLYHKVLEKDLGLVDGVVRAKRSSRLPVVLTIDEVRRLFVHLDGVVLLVCRLLYGAGFRLLECLHMRVKDIDFERNEITVRDGKGGKDRVTMLPASCKQALSEHLQRMRQLHLEDLRRGLGRVPLPHALARKYLGADGEWAWQYVFPASSHYTDARSGIRHRHVGEKLLEIRLLHVFLLVAECDLEEATTYERRCGRGHGRPGTSAAQRLWFNDALQLTKPAQAMELRS
jgi:integron integrase